RPAGPIWRHQSVLFRMGGRPEGVPGSLWHAWASPLSEVAQLRPCRPLLFGPCPRGDGAEDDHIDSDPSGRPSGAKLAGGYPRLALGRYHRTAKIVSPRTIPLAQRARIPQQALGEKRE